MTFLAPHFLSLGLGTAALVFLAGWSQAGRCRRLQNFLGGSGAGARLASRPLQSVPWLRILLLALGAFGVSAGAADPRRIVEEVDPVPPPLTRNLMLAIDVSASMQATDLSGTRLARAVEVAGEILDRVPRDRVGLLLFAGSAYPIARPTSDHAALRYLLAGVVPTIASAHDPGTLLTVGIEAGAQLLDAGAGEGEERILILIGDGEAGEGEGGILAGAGVAAADGVVLHAIGVGTAAGGRVVLPTAPFQLGGLVVDEARRPVVSRLEGESLLALAGAGRGGYADVEDPVALEALLRTIEGPPPPEVDPVGVDPTSLELWPAFGLAALLLLLCESLFELRLPGRMGRLARRVAISEEKAR